MPEISIIIPVYNAETTLKLCVDSILSQSFKDFELLLIDDGSKDKSPAICDLYAKTDSRVRVFHKQNGGVSAARNLGLEHAEGKWITFIDSDDYVESCFLTDCSTHSSDLMLVGMKSFRAHNPRIYTIYNYEKTTTLSNEELKGLLMKSVSDLLFRSPCAKFYKRELIGNIRFHEDMKVAEDACFVLDYLTNVNSIRCERTGSYVIRLSPQSANVKYSLDVDNAIRSLGYLHRAYKYVDEKFKIGRYGFFSFIGYFKYISQDDWRNKKSRWFCNKQIKELYKYVWPELSSKQRFNLMGSFLLGWLQH